MGHAKPAPKICVYCHGRRWVDDEFWEPDHPSFNPPEREPRSGLIPCGSCNFAGWDTPLGSPPAEEDQVRKHSGVSP